MNNAEYNTWITKRFAMCITWDEIAYAMRKNRLQLKYSPAHAKLYTMEDKYEKYVPHQLET